MDGWRSLRSVSVGLACLGLILPGSVVNGAQPVNLLHRVAPTYDVKLDQRGTLRGFVLDAKGFPQVGIALVVRHSGRNVATTRTDKLGRFSVSGLRSGYYQLLTGANETRFRLWAVRTAPPHARPAAQIILGSDVVRGQRPLKEFLTSDVVLMTGLIGAMVAVPIIVHKARQRTAASK